MEVAFHHAGESHPLTFVVILARHRSRWVFCRHRSRDTLEAPGGHIESGETPEAAARRELWEETGATEFVLKEVCAYSVSGDGKTTCGMLYTAHITAFAPLPQSEIQQVLLLEDLPQNWTYPQIQPKLLDYAIQHNFL